MMLLRMPGPTWRHGRSVVGGGWHPNRRCLFSKTNIWEYMRLSGLEANGRLLEIDNGNFDCIIILFVQSNVHLLHCILVSVIIR